MADPFDRYQDAARALLLLSSPTLNQRSGQFLGGLMFSDGPLSDKQARWLSVLLDKHDLPALADGGDL